MPTGSIWLISTQKVLKTQSVKSVEQHYLGSNKWIWLEGLRMIRVPVGIWNQQNL